MTYARLGLAALVASAFRSAVADPAQQEQLDRQDEHITAVRGALDGMNSRLEAIAEKVAAGEALDTDQSIDLTGIKAELAELANVLTGPADDNTDNGLIGEVQPAPIVVDPATDVTASPTVDTAIEDETEVVVPEPIPVEPAATSEG